MLKNIFNKLRAYGRIKGGVSILGRGSLSFTSSHVAADHEVYKNEKASQERLNTIMRQEQSRYIKNSKGVGPNITNGNSGGRDSNNGNMSGRMPPEEYLPGRLASQFDYRSDGNMTFKEASYTEGYQQSEYSIAREIIVFEGGYIEISAGTLGGLHETYYNRNGKKAKRVKHNTYHLAGNHHIHPNQKDKSKSYYSRPQRWYGKNSLISKIIDKGPKNTK